MNENKTLRRRENAIIRGLDGLTIKNMQDAAILHKQGINPANITVNRVKRAFTVLATIDRLPGRQFFGISIANPTTILEANK